MRRSIMNRLALAVIAAACPLTTAVAATVNSPPVGTASQEVASNVPNFGNVWNGIGQSVTAVDQNVTFGFYLFGNGVASSITYSLYAGDGLFGPLLKQVNVTSPATGFFSTTTPTMADFGDIDLVAGQKYTFLATMAGFGFPSLGTNSSALAKYAATDSYADGRFYFSGSPYNQNQPAFSTRDLAFSMIGVSAVPEPAAWAMMITGFAIAAATIRRRRRHVNFAMNNMA